MKCLQRQLIFRVTIRETAHFCSSSIPADIPCVRWLVSSARTRLTGPIRSRTNTHYTHDDGNGMLEKNDDASQRFMYSVIVVVVDMSLRSLAPIDRIFIRLVYFCCHIFRPKSRPKKKVKINKRIEWQIARDCVDFYYVHLVCGDCGDGARVSFANLAWRMCPYIISYVVRNRLFCSFIDWRWQLPIRVRGNILHSFIRDGFIRSLLSISCSSFFRPLLVHSPAIRTNAIS